LNACTPPSSRITFSGKMEDGNRINNAKEWMDLIRKSFAGCRISPQKSVVKGRLLGDI